MTRRISGVLRQGNRGQTLVIIAIMLMVLILMAGLAIDVGVMYVARRELVRVADSAALAGAGALSSGEPGEPNDWVRQQRAVARAYEYARLNGFDAEAPGNTFSVEVIIAERKLVQVNATRSVPLFFMPIIGVHHATVSAHAEGCQAEAAPVDIVLVQDVSGSQCYSSHLPGEGCDDIAMNPPTGGTDRPQEYDPEEPTWLNSPSRWFRNAKNAWWPGCRVGGHWQLCPSGWATSINQPWEPFSLQQTAARYFVSQLDARYDQIALVSFSSGGISTNWGPTYNARTWVPLTNDLSQVIDAIGYSPLTDGEVGDQGLYPGGSTNMAAGIKEGVRVLTSSANARDDAVQVMILLSDGAPTVRLNGGSGGSGCNLQTGQNCDYARKDARDEADRAAEQGVMVYTVFVGTSTFAETQALMLQYIADRTDNRTLEGSYSTLISNGGPAYDTEYFQEHISPNYFIANSQEELERAYDQILERIYTRLVR